jgi:ADP-ribose pyrophosphatase YjhB (NUDIX family)
MPDTTQKVVSIILIRDDKLLIVKKKSAWFLPGGKMLAGENQHECIFREMEEELPDVKFNIDSFFHTVSGESPNTNTPTTVYSYLGIFKSGRLETSHEISEAIWADAQDLRKKQISKLTQEIIEQLVEEGYLEGNPPE